MSRRVLIICYYFPPLGLAGVGRPLNLFKYLPEHNWDCDVLTVKPVTYRAYEPELLDGLDISRIHRSGSYDPQRLMYLAGWRKAGQGTLHGTENVRARYFPDSKRGWIGPAVRMGRHLMAANRYDLVLSTSPPISSHLIAQRLHQETGVKWVADFRDYWTSSKAEDCYRKPILVKRAHAILRIIADEAVCITAVNNSVAAYVGASRVITNGYDPKLAEGWSEPNLGSLFCIGLLGTFGQLNPLQPLVEVVNAVTEKLAGKTNKLKVIQVGNIDDQGRATLARLEDLGVAVQLHGRKSRAETIRLLSDVHCFYQSLQLGWGEGLTSARIFDSLASGRPILAFGDKGGEVDTLVRSTGNGLTFDNDSIATAVEYLATLVSKWESGIQIVRTRPGYAEPFRWDRIAGQFATLFDEVS